MTISRIAAALPAATLIAIAGCGILPGGGSPALDSHEYVSLAVTVDGAQRPVVEGTRLRIGFADGAISASAGCNQFGGQYRLDGEVLVVTDGSMTEMACQPPIHEQETWYFALLGAQPIVAVSGDGLVLEKGGTVITMLDREVVEPDLPLVGTTWALTSIVDGDAAASVPTGVLATLIFTEEGLVMVNTGCNSGGGAVVIGTGTVRFGEIALTQRACEDPADDVERAMVRILRADVVAYAIDAQTLVLTIGDRGLEFVGAP